MGASASQPDEAMDRIDDLLEKTSRTFALSIPLLPEPTRREVAIAYLLFRIADTFEDATRWQPEQQVAALEEFIELIERPDRQRAREAAARWCAEPPIEHDGYMELLADTPRVLDELARLDAEARDIVVRHTIRTARGMAGFVNRVQSGSVHLRDLADLQRYCYTVAGIVGELSTALFLRQRDQLQAIAAELQQRAARFGEALQLVNILKDSAFDTDEGRFYLPPTIPRAEVMALAHDDLETAGEYTRLLQRAGAPRGVVAFCALPVRLAAAALQRVAAEGPGAKVSREQVWEIVAAMNAALDEGSPAVPLQVATTR